MFTVIIPAFNAEKTIERCISSILYQDYDDYEVLVIDDCSQDKTLSILNQIKSDRLRIISLDKNRGVSFARNIGIQKAKGEWITFVDADDYVSSQYLSCLDDSDYDYVALSYMDMDEKGNVLQEIQHQEQAGYINCTDDIVKLLKTRSYNLPWGKRFKRSLLLEKNIMFDEELRYSEDIVFMHKLSRNIKSFKLKKDIELSHVMYAQDTLSFMSGKVGFPENSLWRKKSLQIMNDIPEFRRIIEWQQLYLLESEISKVSNSNQSNRNKIKKIQSMIENEVTKICITGNKDYFNRITYYLIKCKMYRTLIYRYKNK